MPVITQDVICFGSHGVHAVDQSSSGGGSSNEGDGGDVAGSGSGRGDGGGGGSSAVQLSAGGEECVDGGDGRSVGSGDSGSDTGANQKKTKYATICKFLSLRNPKFVGTEDVIHEYLSSKAYKDFITEDAHLHDDDVMGDLPSGIHVSEKDFLVAMMHAYIANFAQALGCNIYSDKSESRGWESWWR